VRLVIDLQACQSEVSAGRGIGRYAEGLATHVARQIGDDDLRVCFSAAYGASLQKNLDVFDLHIGRMRLSAYRYPRVASHGTKTRATTQGVAEALVKRHWMTLQPDVLHVAHVFEGFHGQAVVPGALPKVPGLVRTATLYDLIPLRFPEYYLADPAYKAWYLDKLGALRECERVLAISEATRADAIELLGMDAQRITTIGGGIDAAFRRRPPDAQGAAALRARLGLTRRLVLYTGGDDHRKNLRGAIAGFAALPAPVRATTQLLIVCSLSASTRHALQEQARRLGLGADEVILPGYLAEDELVALYRLCDAFVFPSLYEGLGLPVLEAMACGAPVLGANNSGTAEVIGRADALFDARVPEAMAARLVAVLGDAAFADELRRHGVRRAGQYTWERSAGLALEALRDAHARQQPRAAGVAVGDIPKRRLALFTPLPPCRSGIADYNAVFLPYLARHFAIDIFVDDYDVSDAELRARFTIRPHREFAARRGEYEGIVYEMGNSEFHAYMLDYAARYPGIVVLHDAYLSGLYGYVDFNLGRAGSYRRALLEAHGPRARRYLAPVQENADPIGTTMVNLPVSKSVIDAAIGVISHTPFNLEVARQNYPEAWAAPYRIIKQMARMPAPIGPVARAALRAELGYGEHDFVVGTFGHITWTKSGAVLLEAFARSALAADPCAKLVFVGELARDAFGHDLRRAIDASELRQRMRVTGYLEEAAYAKYLAIADLAVQLRTQTRGGTSKAILDCLAHGVPLIANEAGSFTDYPDDVIRKIAAVPEPAELAAAMSDLHARPAALAELGAAGRAHAAREHAPEGIAAQYAIAIDEFLERSNAASLVTAVRDLGAILAKDDSTLPVVEQSAAALHEGMLRTLFARQRILVDVTHIADQDLQTGIQRVVRNVVRWLYCSNRAGFDVVAVRLEPGMLVEAAQWLHAEGVIEAAESTRAGDASRRAPIELRWGDILLMLDSSWAKIDDWLPLFDAVRRHNGKVYCVVYDLLPIRFPHLFVEGGAAWFTNWLDKAVRGSDGLVCISRAVVEELQAWAHARGASLPARIGFWHLGCDFRPAITSAVTERVQQAMRGRTLLMVGTIEPRKNHALALDAFEVLWARGVDAKLCIAGKPGWSVEKFLSRVFGHAEYGRRLQFIDSPGDEELHHCYARSVALLLPSAGEGFGLPLIEAAQFGTPIVASDIPVFREIAGEHATYFPLGTPEQLATVLETWLAAPVETVPQSTGMQRLTWEQSAEALLDVVLENRWLELPPDSEPS
jgi:glycosyltransferase involved in cell wall biosynthesis